MIRRATLLVTLSLLVPGVTACNDSSSDCTEVAGAEQTIAIQHRYGLEADEEGPSGASGEDSGGEARVLEDLMKGNGAVHGALLTVFDSKSASPDEIGRDAMAAIMRQVDRTGSGPSAMSFEPIETTPVTLAGMKARRAQLTTTDDITYTTWIIPGDERSLDLVLAQSAESARDVDLAEKVPVLVDAGGCTA